MNSTTIGNEAAIEIVAAEWEDAVAKAWDSMGRYKFEMFGYWAAKSVSYGQLIERLGGRKPASPFRDLVHMARRIGDAGPTPPPDQD